MTQQNPTPEQQINHLKIKFADVTLANIAMQEQANNLRTALEDVQTELKELKAKMEEPKKLKKE